LFDPSRSDRYAHWFEENLGRLSGSSPDVSVTEDCY
jgi:hypothetical protein